MTSFSQKLINARRHFMLDAAQQWRLLTSKRKAHLEKFLTPVPDILETPKTAAKFKAREALRATRKNCHLVEFDAAASVGRIFKRADSRSIPVIQGNGVLLANGLFLCNNHVLSIAEDAANLTVEFGGQISVEKPRVYKLNPKAFFIGDKSIDMSLVAVNEFSETQDPIAAERFAQLTDADGMIRIGDPINIAQWNSSRAAISVGEHRLLDHNKNGAFTYSTNVANVMPGAPIFNSHWELVAIQQCGIPLVEKGRIVSDVHLLKTEEPEKENFVRVGEQGVSVQSIITYLRSIRMMRPEKQALLDAFLLTTTDPLNEKEVPNKLDGGASKLNELVGNKGFDVHLHGDIHINVNSLKDLQKKASGIVNQSLESALQETEKAETLQSLHVNRDYQSREGYNPDFLEGFTIPEPAVGVIALKSVITDDDGEEKIFDYYNFSLAMDKARKMPIWGACNIDLSQMREEGERFEEMQQTNMSDPRMKDSEQLGMDDFDKAHHTIIDAQLFGSNQIVWGNSVSYREQAYADSLHWSNRLLIHRSLAASMQDGIWNKLEHHIASELNLQLPKLSVFAGPIFDNNDPLVSSSKEEQFPLRIWKVIVVRAPGQKGMEIHTYGFMYDLSGPLMDLSIDRLEATRYKTYQAQLADITERSGVAFPEHVQEGDVMKSLSLGRRGRVVLEKLNDVVLRKRIRSNAFQTARP